MNRKIKFYEMDLEVQVAFRCGCRGIVGSRVELPASLCESERTEEGDTKIIKYLTENYDFSGWRCPKKHRYLPPEEREFKEIVEVLDSRGDIVERWR